MDKIETLEIPDLSEIGINDAFEFYHIKRYFDVGARSKNWTNEQYALYIQKSKLLNGLAMRFFNSLTNEALHQCYLEVDIEYAHSFWELFSKCKLYERIPADVFSKTIHGEHIAPNDLFLHKEIVEHYGAVLKQYLLESTDLIRIVIAAYEQDYRDSGEKLYLPRELTGTEICDYLSRYIETPAASPNVLETIARMIPSDRFPVSPELRLKAKRRHGERVNDLSKTGTVMSYAATVSFAEEQTEEKTVEITDDGTHLSYSTEWLRNTLDYPSILNNFIYLFEFADVLQMRCNLVSKRSQRGIFEKIMAHDLKCYYPESAEFSYIFRLSQMQMTAYYSFLNHHKIRYEDVLHWFFSEYLQTEFGCPEMRVSFPSKGSTYAEKCAMICTTLDSVIKQFSLYVKNKEIDFDLVAFTSAPEPFEQIPSLNKEKYIYGAGKDFDWYASMLFSNQCTFSFVPRIHSEKRQYATFYELLKNENVYLSDYREDEHSAFYRLAENDILEISADGKLSLKDIAKIAILKDLYANEVISRYHYPQETEPVFREWIQAGILTEKDGLLSKPEADFFNYLLNRSMYSNSLDIRNKYIHGVQQVTLDEEEHKGLYYILLIVFTILAIKINDDFCIYKTIKKGIITI